MGERNFTKVYENDFPKNSVHITENGNTKTIDLIKTKSDVNYDQDRLEHLFKNEKYYSSVDFKKEANKIKFKSKKQQEKLDEILKNKKIQEETEKLHNVLPKITESEVVPKVAENMSDAINFEIVDMRNAGVNIAEYQKSKHVIIEQIKKQKGISMIKILNWLTNTKIVLMKIWKKFSMMIILMNWVNFGSVLKEI